MSNQQAMDEFYNHTVGSIDGHMQDGSRNVVGERTTGVYNDPRVNGYAEHFKPANISSNAEAEAFQKRYNNNANLVYQDEVLPVALLQYLG